jgi:phytoene desaturase
VQIRTACRVRRIIIDDRRVSGIELPGGQIIETATVVSNVDLPTTNTELIDDRALVSRLRPKAERTRMTPGVLTFYWGIGGRVSGLGHHTIFLPDDYRRAFDDLFGRRRLPRELPFYVAAPSETDPDLAPPGDTAMFVLVPTPLLRDLGEVDWGQIVRETKQQVIERMRRHDVDFDARKILVEEVLTPGDWRARYGLYEGSAFGAAHTFFQVGPFRARNYSPDVAGLYYVGASTTPGTGMPMVVLGGKMTAARIASHNR